MSIRLPVIGALLVTISIVAASLAASSSLAQERTVDVWIAALRDDDWQDRRQAAEALGILGVDIALPDSVQLEILRAGGVRAGLIDLTADSRDALFRALAEGRERGLAGDNLARLIRENIEAGPWRSVETRALVIARTEGAFAANQSVIQAARSMDGVERMMMHDNRTGFDDDICPQIDGTVVTIDEAEALMADEHPNGTRSATPLPPLLAEELGV